MPTRVKLRPGRFQPSHGPWIHKDEVAKVLGPPDPAGLVEVIDQRDQTFGWGLVSADADIRVRLVSHGAAQPPDDWLDRRLHAALAARAALGLADDPDTTAYREVNSEGDGLPGLTVDRYGDDRVVQLATPAMAARRAAIAGFFASRTPGRLFVFAPQSAQTRERFALEPQLHGDDAVLEYRQNGLVFTTPAPPAQKTGAYLDQRDNQRLVAELARRVGGPLLDLGCHVGGFALHAAARGLDVVGLDQSARALSFARRNAALNDLSQRSAWVQADMFAPLADPALAGPFSVVVVDPPRMVSRPGQVERGRLALRECLARVIPRVRPGGFVVVCSCSHHLDRRHLDEAVFAASRRDPAAWPAGPELTRVHALGPGPDHPVWPTHHQGEYLRVNVYQRRDP